MKPFLIALGFLAAALIIAQLVMGQLILSGTDLKKAHQHTGYMAVVVALVYIGLSLPRIIASPPAPKP